MAQFLLLLHEKPEEFAQISPAQMQQVIEKYRAWHEKLAAEQKLVDGRKLTDEFGRVLRPSDSEPLVTDGPYSETKEVIGGFFVVEAADYDAACTLASDCPHLVYGGSIEVREIDPV